MANPSLNVNRIYLNSSSSVTHGTVSVSYDADTGKMTFGGTIDQITLNADGTATAAIDSIVYDIIPIKTENAPKTTFEIASGAVIKNMVLNAPVSVTGSGKIEKMEVHSNGVVIDKSVDVKLENITVDEGLEIKIGDTVYIGDGEVPLAGTPPTSSSGSSSGRNSGTKTVSVTGVTLSKTALSLTVGETGTLTATVTPSNATNKSVKWSSSDTSVATVSGGVVTAVAAGNAVITVTTSDGNKTATCAVTVSATPISYTVTLTNDGNGSAVASPASAKQGETVTITAIPNNATNFEFMEWEVVSGGVTLSSSTSSPATFDMPSVNVEIRAKFKPTAAGIAAEAAKITGFTAGTNNTNNLVFNATGYDNLTSDATLTMMDIKTGADSSSASTTDLGATISGGVLSLNTQNTVDAAYLTYVSVTFTAALNGVESAPVTLDISSLFEANTTAGKLRTDKAKLKPLSDGPVDGFKYGNITLNNYYSLTPPIELSSGVEMPIVYASFCDLGDGFNSRDISMKGEDGIIKMALANMPVESNGNASFDNIMLSCNGTSYVIPYTVTVHMYF